MKNENSKRGGSFGSGRAGSDQSSYKWLVLAVVMVGTFMVILDSSIVNVALPKIMAAFGIPIDTAEWVLNGYLISFGALLPASGWFADRFGYRKIFTLSLIIFTLGSFLCAISWDEKALIFFRVFQGIGGGMLMPVGMAAVLREFPYEKRGTALGFWAVAAAGSSSFGPIVGGYLVDRFDWSSIFLINVPIGILGVFAAWAILKDYKAERSHNFDWVGFGSMTTFIVTLLLSLADGNAAWNTGGWTSTFILTNFLIAGISLIVFLVNELTSRHPMINIKLFKSFNYSMSNLVFFIFGLSAFGSNFLLPLYLQNSIGYTAFQAGLVYLPMGIIQGILAPFAGVLTDRINPKFIAIAGIVLLASSWYLNGFLSLFSMHSQIIFPIYLRGFGMAFIFTPLSAIALRDIGKRDIAQASGMFNVIRQVGRSFGLAIIGTIFTERTLFHTAIDGQSMNQYSPAFQKVLSNLNYFCMRVLSGPPGIETQRASALILSNVSQQATVQASDDAFLFAFAIMILCVVPVIFLRTRHKKGESSKAAAIG